MSTVYNWQLGRDMAYPFEAAYPDRQFAFVFNINRCLGCQTCTMACKSTWTFSQGQEHMWWNNVETKPYGGYPRHWDVRLLELLHQAGALGTWNPASPTPQAPYGNYNGRTVFEAAAAGHPGRRMDAKRNQTAPSEPRVEPRTLIDAENHDRVDGHDPLTATATAASSGMGRASPRRRPTATVSAKHAAKPPIIRKAATSHDAVPAKDTASKATTKPGMT